MADPSLPPANEVQPELFTIGHSNHPLARFLDLLGTHRIEEVADKTIWGTDWPSPGIKSMRTNADAFLALPLGDETKRKIVQDNAAKVWRA